MKIYIFIFAICIIAVNAEARKRKYDDNFSDYPVYNSNIRYQRGYFRKDGTYVESHYKTVRDEYKNNNFSSYPNTNPYTGKKGYKRLDKEYYY